MMWSAKKSYLTVYRVDMEKKKKSWSNSTKCLGWHFLCIFLANTMGNLLENTESKRIVCFHAERRMNGLTVCCPTLYFTAVQNASLLLMIKQCWTSNTELITSDEVFFIRPDSQSSDFSTFTIIQDTYFVFFMEINKSFVHRIVSLTGYFMFL